jgi:hypothetical protein
VAGFAGEVRWASLAAGAAYVAVLITVVAIVGYGWRPGATRASSMPPRGRAVRERTKLVPGLRRA